MNDDTSQREDSYYFAVIMHPTFADLSDWVTSGLKGQVSNAAMFTFAIIFFGVMMDAGVFDKIVGKMMLGAKTVQLYVF